MLRHNFQLRDKISDISSAVKEAIDKVIRIKKTVVTHRDLPEDLKLRSKLSQIHNDQIEVVMAQKYLKGLNQKIGLIEGKSKLVEHKNTLWLLTKEINKLKSHKNKLLNQLYDQ